MISFNAKMYLHTQLTEVQVNCAYFKNKNGDITYYFI